MAKKPTPVPQSKEVVIEMEAVEQSISAANSLALITTQQNERVTALARQLCYPGSTDLGALENSARDAAEYLGKSIYALGTCLLLLKEGAPKGQFLPTLERLGISPDSAQRYMAMTRRFANTATSRHLEKLGFSKMTELLPLDDEQIEALSGLGLTGELALDDVARMSVRELRAAVRKERQVKQRLESVNTELHSEVIQLKLDRKIVADTDWPDALKPLADQVAAAGRKLAQSVSELEICRITLFEAAQAIPETQQVKFEAAVGHVAEVYEAALSRAERSLEKERLTFDKTLGNFGGEGSQP
jgi:hypothetical protein